MDTNQTFTVTLSAQQAQTILDLLDLAVKYGGLPAAVHAVAIATYLQEAKAKADSEKANPT